jgi:hypothetical protein
VVCVVSGSRSAPKGRFHFSLWYNYIGDPITSHRFNDAYPNQLPAGENLVDAIHTIDVEFVTALEMLGGARFYGDSGLYATLGIGKPLTESINGSAVRVIGQIG